MPARTLKILLVVGGDSAESDVSIHTGRAVFAALKERGHDVLVADPHRPYIPPTDEPGVFFDDAEVTETPPTFGSDVFVARRRFINVVKDLERLDRDVVFNALHGGAGEDGTFQAVLDYLGVSYTGCGPRACALAMDKELSKRLVGAAGVPVARHMYLDSKMDSINDVDQQLRGTLKLPAVVKPNNEGSSVGVTIVNTYDELESAVREAKEFGGHYLIEEFIPGKEITIGILDGEDLPALEIKPKKGFYDYRNKYQPGGCEYIVPAPLDTPVARALSSAAKLAYRVLGCRHYARIDFRVTDEGEPYFLEANTLPGLTEGSLFPKSALGAGIVYRQMVDKILRLAMP